MKSDSPAFEVDWSLPVYSVCCHTFSTLVLHALQYLISPRRIPSSLLLNSFTAAAIYVGFCWLSQCHHSRLVVLLMSVRVRPSIRPGDMIAAICDATPYRNAAARVSSLVVDCIRSAATIHYDTFLPFAPSSLGSFARDHQTKWREWMARGCHEIGTIFNSGNRGPLMGL